MIYRSRPSAPPSFECSPLRMNQEKEIGEWVKNPDGPLNFNVRHKEVLGLIPDLLDCFDYKCPFCEVRLDINNTEIFFYRPAYRALQEPNGIPDEHHYCWLFWEWSNLYPACESCANHKGMWFPTKGPRVILGERQPEALDQEVPLLLNPCVDKPEKHLKFNEDGSVSGKSDRGRKTIEVLGLNRDTLQTAREAEAKQLRLFFVQGIARWKSEGKPFRPNPEEYERHCGDDQTFAGMKRQLWRHWMIDPPELDPSYPPEQLSNQTPYPAQKPELDPAGCTLIVTVTKIEAQVVLEVFCKSVDRISIGNKTYYNLGIHNGKQVFMVQSEVGIGQPGGSLITVLNAIQDLHPQEVIMCGIAFGFRPDKQKLGDILVARQLEYYEPQKIDFRKGHLPRGDRAMCSEQLLDRFRSGDLTWKGAPTHFGLMLSGEKLVNDPSFRASLLEIEPEAVGGEMEGAGLYAAARDTKVDWILVKAVCDWADGEKNDNAQQQAACNAARFILHVLTEVPEHA